MNYAISTYSQHPDEAFDAAMCLRNAENQLQAAIDAGDVPALRTVFDQPEFSEAYPMTGRHADRAGERRAAAGRRRSTRTSRRSLSTTLSPPAAINPQASADELRTSIQDAIEGKGILP